MTSRNTTYENQWKKMMFSFFDYQPMRKQNATREEWNVRRLVWDFKAGKNFFSVANLVAKKIVAIYGAKASEVVFACIPASSDVKNEIRYKAFSELVCKLTGAINAYNHIEVKGERLAIHESREGKKLNSVEVINFDESFFAGKQVLVFDDILTRGLSYAKFANKLEQFGANVLGGMFLGRTALV